jgi:hypothetical protein
MRYDQLRYVKSRELPDLPIIAKLRFELRLFSRSITTDSIRKQADVQWIVVNDGQGVNVVRQKMLTA